MLAIDFLLLTLPTTFKDDLLTKYAQHTKVADLVHKHSMRGKTNSPLRMDFGKNLFEHIRYVTYLKLYGLIIWRLYKWAFRLYYKSIYSLQLPRFWCRSELVIRNHSRDIWQINFILKLLHMIWIISENESTYQIFLVAFVVLEFSAG